MLKPRHCNQFRPVTVRFHAARTGLRPPARHGSVLVMLVAVCLAAFMLRPVAATQGPSDQGEHLLSLLGQMESSYSRVNDYTAVFSKKECYEGKTLPEERIMVKFQKPLKVYMKWLDGPSKEALYVHGEYDNKVLAHCEGLLGLVTWTFNPTDKALMHENRHPITDLGFGFIIQMMRRDIPVALSRGELEIVRMDEESFQGRPATAIELRMRPHDGRQYYTAHAIFHVDKEYLLPVGVVCYDENEVLQEKYTYQDVKLNAGLSELDFSKGNKAYKF